MEHFLSQLDVYLQTSLLLSFAVAYLGGVLVSMTPCVYPMIPITIGVVSGSNIGGSKVHGFLLSLAYVTGMALTYAGLGVLSAATGLFFGTINTSPWTFLFVGNILLLFGLSMLGVFHFPTIGPQIAAKFKGVPGIFVLGIASGLIAGPCTAPVLGGLLTYAATTQNLVQGGILLFIFAFGMGSILLAAGTFSALLSSIPRSGAWTEKINLILGLFMIGLAEYFIFRAGTFLL